MRVTSHCSRLRQLSLENVTLELKAGAQQALQGLQELVLGEEGEVVVAQAAGQRKPLLLLPGVARLQQQASSSCADLKKLLAMCPQVKVSAVELLVRPEASTCLCFRTAFSALLCAMATCMHQASCAAA